MRYEKFSIKNFKGIKDTTVDLRSLTNVNVFSLVGLNESGKTTLLEAIHSFAPDDLSGKLITAESEEDATIAQARVPRHKLANFSGDVSVEATVVLQDGDEEKIREYALDEYDLQIEKGDFPDRIVINKIHRFDRGDFEGDFVEMDFLPKVKKKKQRNFRKQTPEDISLIWNCFYAYVPAIAYYPTFIFDFPDRIYLTPRRGSFSRFYKSVFADVLSNDGQGYTTDDIIRRVRAPELLMAWSEFLPKWTMGDSRAKVKQIVDRASASMTHVVLGKWNKIFGEDASGKEVAVEYELEEGRKYNAETKSLEPSDLHDIYVWFEIKDGSRRFKVNDRSLGFRWFFAFLLFTQFRVSSASGRPLLFLFDEPASNLHAAAQQKLIESFPEIATGNNMLIYSTHSHYMIDPAWLEQCFIVTNRADAPDGSIIGNALIDDEALDIRAARYRAFLNENPSDTSYFQPIKDRLDVVPSRFDYSLPSIVVEGKSDYHLLEYVRRRFGPDDLRLLPATGSGTFSALISLSVGWGTKFLFMLDSDGAGLKEKARYSSDFGARSDALRTIQDYVPGAKDIESLLDERAREKIRDHLRLTKKPNKKQIQRFFQEMLAKGEYVPLGNSFIAKTKNLLTKLGTDLDDLHP
ncbi:ATP-dependent nuclease [Erythrobacter ani]|uniref:AAA family ATPase n=1 Tax=Erythrobacter ani TaxID=2827235 RepID=A0ABS6SQI5_9SPHN|nr:AAA family ATPase [Erythrobacter ani]MBV7266702.1 AAA family ATPase [Erythrobacter ani]